MWLDHAHFGKVPPTRQHVDGNAAAFDAIDANTIYVLGATGDGALWLEHGPFGVVPPPRQLVDLNVAAFDAVGANDVYVLGSNGALWLEHGPFGSVPPARQLVDEVEMPKLDLTLQRNQLGYDVSYQGTGFPSGRNLQLRVTGWSDDRRLWELA